MTISGRSGAANVEDTAGMNISCDSCDCDLTHSVRIKCADPVCDVGEGIDICPSCFCKGKEFKDHKRGHPYRVIELPAFPIFTEDWGADEELLLIEGAMLQGLGNWTAIAEHIGGRTKDDVEKHYMEVYINSPDWPMPDMTKSFDIDPEEFHRRKRQRIEELPAINASAVPKPAPTSAPGFHEIQTFLPGRLEFEHEIDNDAEDLVKDLEFGLVYQFGGDKMPEDEEDLDVKAKYARLERVQNGVNGDSSSSSLSRLSIVPMDVDIKEEEIEKDSTPVRGDSSQDKDKDGEKDDAPHVPLPIETEDSVAFKLTLIEMYLQRVEKRHQAKAFIFERGLLEYKKMQAQDKKRSKEDKEILHRFRPYAKLQTAEDYEKWVDGMLFEATLRKRIAILQTYRRMGLTSLGEAEKYEADIAKRIQAKASIGREWSYTNRSAGPLAIRGTSQAAESEGRKSRDRDSTPVVNGAAVNGAHPASRRFPAPLNLANSPSLALLSPAEQTLCSQLRILPKPYLVIKEILIGAYIKSGGTLRKREARELVKIDVNKSARIWDFFAQSGWLKLPEQAVPAPEPMQVDSSSTPQRIIAPTMTRENSAQSGGTSMLPLVQSSNKVGIDTPPLSTHGTMTTGTTTSISTIPNT